MRVWNKESIQDLIARNDLAVQKAIVAIYGRQTRGEQDGGGTNLRNGEGFGLFDAKLFSDMAKKILAGGTLEHGQIEYARRKGIGKYWKQLADIANSHEIEKERARRDKAMYDKIAKDYPVRSHILRRSERAQAQGEGITA